MKQERYWVVFVVFCQCAATNLKNIIISYLALQASCVSNGVTLIL